MCGRFFLSAPGPVLAAEFGLATAPALAPRFNLAPGQPVPLVRARVGEDGVVERILDQPRWGLVAHWARDPRAGPRPINARAEAAADSPLFRSALARRRGLVPADGFYEWQRVGRSTRPFAIRPRAGGLLAMAALFERWRNGEEELETCAILTTEARGPVRAIHDRMPLLVAPDQRARWLDPTLHDPAVLAPLLVPGPDDLLVARPVDRRVNDVRQDDAGLLEPERDLFSAGGAA